MVPRNTFILVREKEAVVSIDHPPKLKRFKCPEYDKLSEIRIKDLPIDNYQEQSDDVVNKLDTSKESVVTDPLLHKNTTWWLLQKATGNEQESKDKILK